MTELDGCAIREVAHLARDAAKPNTIEVDDHTYSRGEPLMAVLPPKLDVPPIVVMATLQGLADYLEHDMDDLAALGVMSVVHVVGPCQVEVITGVIGKRAQRFAVARAMCAQLDVACGWEDPGDMVTKLQTWCDVELSPTLADLTKAIGTVQHEQAVKIEDDGVSQTVHVRQGIAHIGDTTLPNPVTLAPYRTFREVAQPASPFLLRARGGGTGGPIQVKLFEADGGTWELEAVERIKEWLIRAGVKLPIIC